MTLYGAALLTVMLGATMAALDLALFALTPALLRSLSRVPRARRARMILVVRSAPVVASVLLIGLVFLPAWLAHEPSATDEVASPLLLLLAAISLLPFASGLVSGGRMLLRTRERLAAWRRRALGRSTDAAPCEVLEVSGAEVAVCVGGYFRPTIYASTDVVDALEPAEFKAVLAHESAHAHARDPLRLLWMASCPDFLRAFGQDEDWRREFARACEFAADESACRRGPDAALDLATGLLKVARLRLFPDSSATALSGVAVSSAFASREDIETRVRALLEDVEPEPPHRGSRSRALVTLALALALWGGGLSVSEHVHGWTELVGSVLAPR